MRLKKNGIKGGFPRFKSFDRMKSLVYPQSGFYLDKRLKVSPFGELKIKQHREVDGEIKTLTLKRMPSGRWFAIFVVEKESQESRHNTGSRIGIDLGLKSFATLSDGTKITNPRHFIKYEERLAFLQRRLSQRKKGSQNRRTAKLKVARLHEKVSNIRLDFLHKTSTDLVSRYSFIVLEQLSTQELSQQNYGKQINDAGWNMFANMLRYKAESAGCEVVFVDPENTTKTCSSCGAEQDMPLSERIYYCPKCGSLKDRDMNASINVTTQPHYQIKPHLVE